MQNELIVNKIKAALTDAHVVLESPDGVHYSAIITSPDFVGKSRLEQHRMVMKAFEESIASNELHALSLKTRVPES